MEPSCASIRGGETMLDDDLLDARSQRRAPEHPRHQLARWAEARLYAPIALLCNGDLAAPLPLCAETLVPTWRELTETGQAERDTHTDVASS
jgi:hypothetical protein